MRLAVGMRVRMLGTGSSDGWPNPWCSCASCRAARADGVLRGQTSALVDDRLLLDVGHDGVRAAQRFGVDLTGVEAVLVTHAHPDHHAWPAWTWRGWAAGSRPLTLVAPAAVLADARPRLDPTVSAVQVAAGDRLTVAGYEVVVLPARHAGPDVGPAVLYDLTGPDGMRLLWATDTGVLGDEALAQAQDRAYDAVLLELTSAHLPDHHDLRSWPEQVAELRRRGAVVDGTRVFAVHLGHDNPPPAELDGVLGGWGARAPRDGELLDLGAPDAPAPSPRRVVVVGGARSGKSAWAEQRLAAEPVVSYIATAPQRDGDEEWDARVQAHRRRRPASWSTVETADVAAVLTEANAPVLVDDLGLWLTRTVDAAQAWEGPLDEVERSCDELVAAWRSCRTTAVLVAPDVGAGVVPASASGRRFRDLLGALTSRLAAEADEVVHVVAGLPRALR
jgi:adenosylcobinamide kinase/adenosylcobinamide-phosphate guanylyltransferase